MSLPYDCCCKGGKLKSNSARKPVALQTLKPRTPQPSKNNKTTLNPETLKPKLKSLNPKPKTLNPKPKTIQPKP